MALSKVLQFFSNTRFQDNIIPDVDNYLTDKVRSFFMLYKSTTRDVIFLSRSHGGVGVKLFSSVYYCTRVSSIVKMLNHNVEIFRNITRSSLDLDMRKRGISESNENNNFLSYEVNDEGFHRFVCMNSNFTLKFETSEATFLEFAAVLSFAFNSPTLKPKFRFFFQICFSFSNHFTRIDCISTLVSK